MSVTAALAAAQAGSLGAGFSGGGFIIPFFLGVLDVLQRQLGIFTPDTPVAGASSGAIVALTANGMIPLTSIEKEVHHLSAYCRKKGNCYGILQEEVIKIARRLLPANAAERANRKGNIHLAVTYPAPLGENEKPKHELINMFESRDDLMGALAGSIYIPYYAGPHLTMGFRGKQVYDGSFAGRGQGFLPCPPNITYCVRVSSLPPNLKLGSFLVTDLLLGTKADRARAIDIIRTMISGSDIPSSLRARLRAYANDTTIMAEEPGQIQKLVADLMDLVTPGEGEADIWPGRRHGLPVSQLFWTTWMMSPPTPDQIKIMYDLGRAEALSWAEEAGFISGKKSKERSWRSIGGKKRSSGAEKPKAG